MTTDRTRETTTYVIGYVLALGLTLVAFALVRWWSAPAGRIVGAVFILGLIQAVVQFRCFLGIGLKRSARQDLLLVLFASTIVLLMVGGTLVIIFNLRHRMMMM